MNIKSIQPEPFYGLPEEDAADWVNRLKAYFEPARTDKSLKCKIFQLLLRNIASVWFKSLPRAAKSTLNFDDDLATPFLAKLHHDPNDHEKNLQDHHHAMMGVDDFLRNNVETGATTRTKAGTSLGPMTSSTPFPSCSGHHARTLPDHHNSRHGNDNNRHGATLRRHGGTIRSQGAHHRRHGGATRSLGRPHRRHGATRSQGMSQP